MFPSHPPLLIPHQRAYVAHFAARDSDERHIEALAASADAALPDILLALAACERRKVSRTSRRHYQQGKGDKHRANERKHESGEGGGVDRATLRRRGPITRQRVEAVAVPTLHILQFAGHQVSSPASGPRHLYAA